MTPEQRTALDKAHLYIREAETGFLLLEANHKIFLQQDKYNLLSQDYYIL